MSSWTLSIVSSPPSLDLSLFSIMSRVPVPCQHVAFRDRSHGIIVGVPLQQAVGITCGVLKERLRLRFERYGSCVGIPDSLALTHIE